MDPRCPRNLESTPNTWCPLAVLRLKAMRNAGKELSEEEEANMPGCEWAIDHQLANYCFFKYIEEYVGDKPVSDIELASLLNVSVDTIKKIEKSALAKLKRNESFASMKTEDGPLVDEIDNSSYKIHKQ
jgi:hypothetical protein